MLSIVERRADCPSQMARAIGVAGITRRGLRVRFYSTVDLVNALEAEKAQGKAGRIALSLLRMDLVILDELGYLPFSQAGGALLFHPLFKQYHRNLQKGKKMIRRLRAQFLLGFHEGWSMYWSPFAALAREAKKLWASHVHRHEHQLRA